MEVNEAEKMADALATSAASAGVAATGITVASFIPGLDLQAVVGAFGGACLFILFAKNISVFQRVGYLICGWIGGYFAAAELMSLAWTKTSGIASFIGGLLCVTIAISLIEAFTTGKFPAWMISLWEWFRGKRNPQ